MIKDIWILEQSFACVKAWRTCCWLARESCHSSLVCVHSTKKKMRASILLMSSNDISLYWAIWWYSY